MISSLFGASRTAASSEKPLTSAAFLPVGRLIGKEVTDPDATYEIRAVAEEVEESEIEYIPLSRAKESIEKLDMYASRVQAARIEDLEDMKGRLAAMQNKMKARYNAFYNDYVSEVREVARRRLEEQVRMAEEERAILHATNAAAMAEMAAASFAQHADVAARTAARQLTFFETAAEEVLAANSATMAAFGNASSVQRDQEEYRATKEAEREEFQVELAAAKKHEEEAVVAEQQKAVEMRQLAADAAAVAAAASTTSILSAEATTKFEIREACGIALTALLAKLEINLASSQPLAQIYKDSNSTESLAQGSLTEGALNEERKLRESLEEEAAVLSKSNRALLEANAKLEANLLERTVSGMDSLDETTNRLKTQLGDAIQGNKILRDELLALNQTLEDANPTGAEDEAPSRSKSELKKMTNYARLQSRQAHEELKNAQKLINKLKKQVAKLTSSSSPDSPSAATLAEDDTFGLATSSVKGTDSALHDGDSHVVARLRDESAKQRAAIHALEAKLRVLNEGHQKDEAHAAKAEAYAEIVGRKADVVAEVAAAQSAQAQALEKCATIAAELAEAQQKLSVAEKGAQAYVDSIVEAARQADLDSTEESSATESIKAICQALSGAVAEGTTLWRAGKRAECCNIYKTATRRVLSSLPKKSKKEAIPRGWTLGESNLVEEISTTFKTALDHSESQPAARGAVTLRKAFDKILERLAEKLKMPKQQQESSLDAPVMPNLQTPRTANNELASRLQSKLKEAQDECARMAQEVAKANEALHDVERGNADHEAEYAESVKKDRQRARVAEERTTELEAEVDELQAQLAELRESMSGEDKGADEVEGFEHDVPVNGEATRSINAEGESSTAPASRTSSKPASSSASQQRLRAVQKELREERAKVRELEGQLASSGGKAGQDAPRASKLAEKKQAKQLEEAGKKADRATKQAEAAAKKATKEIENLESQVKEIKTERDNLKKKVASLESMSSELSTLRERAEEATRLEAVNKDLSKTMKELETKYKEELALRKKYWNMMEDMKGKIRVFARCRPMAKYEIQKGCKQSVAFLDETTLSVQGSHGPKEFTFDNVFPPVSEGDAGQADVFEDTSNLIQSCLDGFNVCIFAYGQTGSGKTFTMTGVRDNPELRGITPRAIHAIFDNAKAMEGTSSVKISSYFMELYNDNLVDLYDKLDNKGKKAPEKLEIKVDNKKMVFVKGAVIKPAESADELLNLFEAGNAKRHVGATKMNAESSRSHSVFAVLVEVYNKTTKKTSVGKLSLVDLAGSERADKTGATDERLKEAQNINKSLSALGDVIAALSNGEKVR